MRTNLTERDPMSEAVVARGGMLVIGFLFIAFTAVIYYVLTFALQDVLATAGVYIDVWRFLLLFIATFVSLPITSMLKHVLMPNEKKSLQQELSYHISIFSVTRKDWTSQLKHALLMWLLIFVPLDFVSYLIPGMLEFEVNSLYLPPNSGLYLAIPIFGVFISLSILVHLLVALREETLFRGVIQFWGQERVGMTSALVISAIGFGLSHFNYWLNDMSKPIYFGLWWAFSGLFVGLMLGFYLRSTGHIFPMILAHWWNNVVSTIAIWMFLSSGNATTTMMTLGFILYLPLMLCGVILLLVWRNTMGKAVKMVKQEIKSYRNQPPYIIFFDLLFGLGIWLVLVLLGA